MLSGDQYDKRCKKAVEEAESRLISHVLNKGKRRANSENDYKTCLCGQETDTPQFCRRCRAVVFCGSACEETYNEQHRNECYVVSTVISGSLPIQSLGHSEHSSTPCLETATRSGDEALSEPSIIASRVSNMSLAHSAENSKAKESSQTANTEKEEGKYVEQKMSNKDVKHTKPEKEPETEPSEGEESFGAEKRDTAKSQAEKKLRWVEAKMVEVLKVLGWSSGPKELTSASAQSVAKALNIRHDNLAPGWFSNVCLQELSTQEKVKLRQVTLFLYGMLRDEDAWTRDSERSIPSSLYTQSKLLQKRMEGQKTALALFLEYGGHRLLMSLWLQDPQPPGVENIPLELRPVPAIVDSLLQINGIRNAVDKFMDQLHSKNYEQEISVLTAGKH